MGRPETMTLFVPAFGSKKMRERNRKSSFEEKTESEEGVKKGKGTLQLKTKGGTDFKISHVS